MATSAARRSSAERTTPPFPTSLAAHLELWLHEREAVPPRGGDSIRRGNTLVSEMNERSATTRSGAYGSSSGSELARVAPLDHGHARVVAEPPVELAVCRRRARSRALRIALEQAVGEPARGRPGVEALPPGGIEAEARSSAFSSFCPPRETNRGTSATSTCTSSATIWPGFCARRRSSPTRTSPASTAAAARERVSNRPRSAKTASSRLRDMRGAYPRAGSALAHLRERIVPDDRVRPDRRPLRHVHELRNGVVRCQLGKVP